MNALIEALRGAGIEVTPFEHTFNLVRGEGLSAHRVNVELPEVDEADIPAFVLGVEAVMSEPGRSNARTWDYRKTAARVSANVVTPAFLQGANMATGGDPVFSVPLVDELSLVVVVQLDRGTRLITRGQVDDWNATDDRVLAAARSLLYHHTGTPRWEPVNDLVSRLSGNDEFGAVRAIVFEDLFFGDTTKDFRFGLPNQRDFLFVPKSDEASMEALKLAVQAAYAEAEFPLSHGLYAFAQGGIVPAEH